MKKIHFILLFVAILRHFDRYFIQNFASFLFGIFLRDFVTKTYFGDILSVFLMKKSFNKLLILCLNLV